MMKTKTTRFAPENNKVITFFLGEECSSLAKRMGKDNRNKPLTKANIVSILKAVKAVCESNLVLACKPREDDENFYGESFSIIEKKKSTPKRANIALEWTKSSKKSSDWASTNKTKGDKKLSKYSSLFESSSCYADPEEDFPEPEAFIWTDWNNDFQ